MLMALVVGATAACGSDSGAGEAEPVVDLAALDVGSYNAQPAEFKPKGDTRFVGRAFEAERLGGVMPLPSEIDSRLKVNRGDVVHAFMAPGEAHNGPMYSWLKKEGFAEDAPGFVSGFAATGESEEDFGIGFSMSTSALLFESEAQAAAAAGALARRGWELDNNADGHRVQPARSVKHPEAVVSWVPDDQVLASWSATGKFVIVAVAENQENRTLKVSDQDLLLSLTDNAITVTSERLKSFQATPPDQLGTGSLDPEGMLRISLRRPEGDSFEDLPGVYDLRGYLQLIDRPDLSGPKLREYGIDRVGNDAVRVFRTRDAKAAKEFFAYTSVDKYMVRVESPPGLPNARCTKYRGPEHYVTEYDCFVTYGRYVAASWGKQLPDAYQRISAEYSILARSK